MIVASQLDPSCAQYSFDVLAGEPWIHELTQGQTLRIVDLEGNQAVDTLFYNARDYSDRYSAIDTITRQKNIYLTAGTQLISSEGNVLGEIVADTCGRHDTLGGACAMESNMVRYAIEKRDIPPNINFFMNVPVTADGKLTFEDGISDSGKYVEIRAAMDILVLVSNCPQLNNPCNAYNPTPARMLIWNAPV
jgi:uncharacterized protein YcgI (DUF1989 family)